MRRYSCFVCNILVLLVISGCMSGNMPPTVDDLSTVPSMPPLAVLGVENQPEHVFGPYEAYSSSAGGEIGRRGVCEADGAGVCVCAVL